MSWSIALYVDTGLGHDIGSFVVCTDTRQLDDPFDEMVSSHVVTTVKCAWFSLAGTIPSYTSEIY